MSDSCKDFMRQKTCSGANMTAGKKKCSCSDTCDMLAMPQIILTKFFFDLSLLIEYFPPLFAVNCSLATLASDRRRLPVNLQGLLYCLTLELAERGRCRSLLDRHFFNYVLMLTISTEVESAILYWYASCPDISSNFEFTFF